MILKKVKIYNYRQLQKVELDLQNSLTVLAGPNNSGKTTLISVLKGMFRDKKLSFTYSDIPTNLSTSWVEKIIPVFQSIMVENDKNTGISEIIKKISVDDKLLPEYTIECFHAEIQVDYDPTGDDEANKKLLAEYSNQVLNTYRDNKLFEALLKDDFIAYLAKSTVGNAKNIFKISKIEGILTAYKLFYVGCSRARKNLVIVVDETKINKFENEFKAKLISIGFEIQGFPMQETATV